MKEQPTGGSAADQGVRPTWTESGFLTHRQSRFALIGRGAKVTLREAAQNVRQMPQ
jgi:hypothetical protein